MANLRLLLVWVGDAAAGVAVAAVVDAVVAFVGDLVIFGVRG